MVKYGAAPVSTENGNTVIKKFTLEKITDHVFLLTLSLFKWLT